MNASKGFLAEGHSVSRPPFFDGTDYSYWKNRMQVFLRAQDYELWRIVSRGLKELPVDESQWTSEEIRKATLNWSAMNVMQCAIHPQEYSRISSCTSAKEMWDKLELIYEGTSEVKETKANILVHDYEMFKMSPSETISEMYARLSEITNSLNALGKKYSDSDLVRKILRSLPPTWHTKATVIEDSKNLSSFTVEELIGSLMTYEINLNRKEAEMPEKRSRKDMAFKANAKKHVEVSSDASTSSEDEDDIDKLSRSFKKILRFKKNTKGNSGKKEKEMICFGCQGTRGLQ